MSFRFAIVDAYVRSTVECGGSTPLWHNAEEEDQGGVEPPHSRVLRTAIFMRVAVSDNAAKDLGKSTGYVTKNAETPRKGAAFPHSRRQSRWSLPVQLSAIWTSLI